MESSSIRFYIESGASDHTRLVEISASDSGKIYTYGTGIFITVGGADGDKGGGGGTGAGTRKGVAEAIARAPGRRCSSIFQWFL